MFRKIHTWHIWITFGIIGLIGAEDGINDSPDLTKSHAHYKPPMNKISDPYHFIIGVISDDDEKSISKTEPNTYESKFIRGKLMWHENARNLTVEFDTINTRVFYSGLNAKGRGMELSELIYYDRILTSFDDKTGIVYKIKNGELYPWIILASGDGTLNKGFKSEWATIKDDTLIVGSHGMLTSETNQRLKEQNLWVKFISKTGEVKHVNWSQNYEKMRNHTTCSQYLVHESVCWSDFFRRWFFLPRKCSTEPYSQESYNEKSSNILISTDELFDKFLITKIGKTSPGQGFSSFKFLPNSDDSIIVAIKTVEINGNVQSHITAFGLTGELLLADTLISDSLKFEGLEFIHANDSILKYNASEKVVTPSSGTVLPSAKLLAALCCVLVMSISKNRH